MTDHNFQSFFQPATVALLLVLTGGCARQAGKSAGETAGGQTAAEQQVVLRKMPAGKQFSGFLGDYSNLKPNPNIEGDALTFVRIDEEKNLHKYIGMIVDPVQVYVATDVDESTLPAKARGAAASYFHKALVAAVSPAFPIADQPGPLVLRLRSAIIGVDVGGEIPATDKSADPDALDRTVNIGKVGVEMELVDSETGQQIAAMVDRENLGAGAEIGSVSFSRQQKWAAANQAFNAWAHRVRIFLNSAHELSAEDAKRADQSYQPYSDAPGKQ